MVIECICYHLFFLEKIKFVLQKERKFGANLT